MKTIHKLHDKVANTAIALVYLCLLSVSPMLAQTGLDKVPASMENQPINQQQSNPMKESVTCLKFPAIPVALADGQPPRYSVSAELCATAEELTAGTTVQLLIHGATYNRSYWDFGNIDGAEYSYARDVAARGFPAFAVDEIGSGRSSHPPSDELTVQAVGYVNHQIVQGLRNGSIAGVSFGKVIIVGHSLGSTAVWEEAITYQDVDGVIITGAAHSLASRFVNFVPPPFYPAIDDPKFANSGLDKGYLTTVPGLRSALFYSSPDSDPAVVAKDEQRKDLVSATELNTGVQLVFSTATRAIDVPVLTILGSKDLTTCGPNTLGGNFDCSSGSVVAAQEAPFYSPKARIHGCIVPDSGHSLNLALNHQLEAADAVAWSRAFVGQQDSVVARDFNESDRGFSWNDGLPWNCGGVSAVPK